MDNVYAAALILVALGYLIMIGALLVLVWPDFSAAVVAVAGLVGAVVLVEAIAEMPIGRPRHSTWSDVCQGWDCE